MVSKKTILTLTFIIPVVITVAYASNTSSLSKRQNIQIRKRRYMSKGKKTIHVLHDTIDTVKPVEVQERSIEVRNILKELPIIQGNKFEELIEQGKYDELIELGKDMNDEEFLKRICLVVKTPEQYKGIIESVKSRKMVAKFYAYGDVNVVRKAIVESRIYDDKRYVNDGDLEIALPLALKEGNHDRVIELLIVRNEVTAGLDVQLSQKGYGTSFEWFMYSFLLYLAPWNDGVALKRFLTISGEELRDKYPNILNILCEKLVYLLKIRIYDSGAKKMLDDLIGQSTLLTSVPFVKGFSSYSNDEGCSEFIKVAWNGAIEEGLKEKYDWKGKHMWRMMKELHPNRLIGEYPPSNEMLVAVLAHFPTKQKLEDDWNKKNAKILYNKIKGLGFILDLLPIVLWPIITEYAVSWTDV